jgi:hypothetical protein
MKEQYDDIAQAIIKAAYHLGNGDALTNGVGAIEGHAMHSKEGLQEIAAALEGGLQEIATATERGLESIAESIASLDRPTQDIGYAIRELAEAVQGLKQNER